MINQSDFYGRIVETAIAIDRAVKHSINHLALMNCSREDMRAYNRMVRMGLSPEESFQRVQIGYPDSK